MLPDRKIREYSNENCITPWILCQNPFWITRENTNEVYTDGRENCIKCGNLSGSISHLLFIKFESEAKVNISIKGFS